MRKANSQIEDYDFPKICDDLPRFIQEYFS